MRHTRDTAPVPTPADRRWRVKNAARASKRRRFAFAARAIPQQQRCRCSPLFASTTSMAMARTFLPFHRVH